MNVHFEDTLTWGLRTYLRLITEALGLRGECSYVQSQHPMGVYLALDGRLPGFPDHDVALLWDEESGWSAAVESAGGNELTVVDHLGQQVLPAPGAVTRWVHQLRRDESRHRGRPVWLRSASDDDLLARLAAYAVDDLTSRTL